MNIDQLVDHMRNSPEIMQNITYWKEIESRDPVYGPFPKELRPELINVLKKKGIHQLYSHQSKAIELVLKKKNIVVVTPTASGKTNSYNITDIKEKLNKDNKRTMK